MRTTTHRIAVIAAAVAIGMVPWIAYLGASLPAAPVARNWPLAWMGLDGAVAAGLGGLSWLLRRGHTPGVIAAATATATLLLVDAWFDVCTATPGPELATSIAMALSAEIPTAAACAWIARRAAKSTRSEP